MSLLNEHKKPRLRNSAKLPKLTIQQQIDNNEVIERMNRKITFTKNQRHLGQTITYNEALGNTILKKQNAGNSASQAVLSLTNQSLSEKPKFKCVPEMIVFEHFEAHRTYESEVKLVNLSPHIQRIKITPFSRKEFNIFSVQYPKDDSGDVAPGMAVTITIRFKPLNLNDIQEEMLVIFNGGSIEVPIEARRERPSIEWPKLIECGHCWVGNCLQNSVRIVNRGGQAEYTILGSASDSEKEGEQGGTFEVQRSDQFRVGDFVISPSRLKFNKQSDETLTVKFEPRTKGNFDEQLVLRSNQGEREQIAIRLQGGAYSAQLVLEEINSEKVKQQALHNNLYINGTEIGERSTASLRIRNLAVVDVDYFWHFSASDSDSDQQLLNSIEISRLSGKLEASSSFEFSLSYTPVDRESKSVRAELFLVNVPSQSLEGKSSVKVIEGKECIQCLVVNIKTRPKQSSVEVLPLHKQIVDKIYRRIPVEESFRVVNNSGSSRAYRVQLISASSLSELTLVSPQQGTLSPKESKSIRFTFRINELSKEEQRGYFLVEFDNSPAKIFSVGGFVEYPEIKYSQTDIYYGLCRTHTRVRRFLSLKNEQNNALEFQIRNPIRFYELDFYDFYDFDEEESSQFKKPRLTIRDKGTRQEFREGETYSIAAHSEVEVELEYCTMEPCTVSEEIEVVVVNGKSNKIPILVETQEVDMVMSRNEINLRQIYKGNVYNSNKFLSKELSIENRSNIETTFEFEAPDQEGCQVRIEPMLCRVPPKSRQRVDLLIEPVKTGPFRADIAWKYYDDFKVHPQNHPELSALNTFNASEGEKTRVHAQSLCLRAEVKGVEIKYYLKDESRVKRVRQKLEDLPNSVKHSTMSFKSSKTGFHEQDKLIYPGLEELTFYNCEINQVRQMEIIIENDSGLSAEYRIYAENFHTLERPDAQKRSSRGLVRQEEEAFSSEMGRTFLQARVLDKSQKVHLSNNKGVSIMCEPCEGVLHKKQTQKVVVTMFNDTSGRFRDFLVVDVRNHELRKFPMDFSIKGTPVLLSRNQLGIDFNQEIPFMNAGTTLVNNGKVKKSIKVVNKGPKEVHLNWKVYEYGKVHPDRDIFAIQVGEAEPGSSNIAEVRWNAIEPQIDACSPFSIEPRQKTLKGREEASFTLYVSEIESVKRYQNLLICEPELRDGSRTVKMENLAVVVGGESAEPQLSMDSKHGNHVNKLELFSTEHLLKEKETNAHNNFRKIKLKNELRANLEFELGVETQGSCKDCFRIVSVSSNSPINPYDGSKTFVRSKKYTLAHESFIEVLVELAANKRDPSEWPMEAKTRKDGGLLISYSNGGTQRVDLVGWLYRPWMQLQMPGGQLYSADNCTIEFGTVHVSNSRKISVHLLNPSKSDGRFTVSYLKYHQSKPVHFERSLWTPQDYEDMGIADHKECWLLSHDQGVALNRSIPVHYIPGTLALPSPEDQHTQTHKPVRIDFLFKPQKNLLYKSKFRIAIEDGLFFDVVLRGTGTLDEELHKK